jgi:peptidoglycan/xylan/chitin deacetylase (PgdA/CDA1 family)
MKSGIPDIVVEKRDMKNRFYPEKMWLPGVFMALILIVVPAFVSCVTPEKKAEPTQKSPVFESKEPFVFFSNRYAVCYLSERVSSEELAERYLGREDKAWVIEESNGFREYNAGEVVVIPLQEENPGGLTKDGYQIVPILCYNLFAMECEDKHCVSVEEFDKQMGYLAENGYHVIPLSELYDFFNYRSSLPKKTVVITIDQGNKSSYEVAYPILRSWGFSATFFVYADFVEAGKDTLTWDQLKEMKDDGFEIGAHSLCRSDLSHPKSGEGDKAFRERILREFRNSKKILDENLGQDTFSMAYNYGEVSPGVLDICQKAGYRLAVTIQPGENAFFTDPLALKRQHIPGVDSCPFHERLKTFKALSFSTGE